MAALHLQPPPYEQFDCRAEGKNVRWAKWLRRLENNVFSGCGIENPVQRKGLLLMYGGAELNDIVDSLEPALLEPVEAVEAAENRPAVPAQNVYERLTTAITAHFNPRANTEFQRFLFKQTLQTTPEVDEFYGSLRQLAETCDFHDMDGEIKSQLILGCKLDKVRTKGLSDPDITLPQLLQFARNMEMTMAHSKVIKGQAVNAVNYQRNRSGSQQPAQQSQRGRGERRAQRAQHGSRQPQRAQQQRHSNPQATNATRSTRNKSCNYCGGAWNKDHRQECPAQGIECRKCGKQNHFAKVCKSERVRHVTQTEALEDAGEDDEDYAYHINSRPQNESPQFNIRIGNDSVSMMADSGASVNLLSNADYQNMRNPPDLQRSAARIFAYGDKSPIATHGEFVTKLGYKNKECEAKIIVVNGPSSLLSWKTSLKLNLLKAVYAVKDDCESLIREYGELFTGLGKLRDYKVKLHIDNSVQPVAQTHRRIPFHVRKDLEAQLKADETLGVIQRPTGPTPWVSPVVCVPKKSGKIRVCVDMRSANKAIKRERHGTPTINELMNDLNGATVFSKLDLNQGYNQLELDESSRYITTFATHVGLRQFTRLNFGICSAAEVFQEAIRQALAGIPGVINLSDDILVFGKTAAEHDDNLRATFQRLKEKNLTLSREKCEFNKTSLAFFGHIFSKAGLAADPEKIKAILEMKAPQSASEVRSLLGMTNYCGSRFIANYATITHELRELTKKEVSWKWKPQHEEAFQELKKALTRTPVLRYFDPALQTQLHVDASPVGLCAILTQTDENGIEQTVQYASRALTPVEQRYSQTEREALAVVWACEHLHLYVMGSPVTIYTDHKPLVSLYNNPRSKPTARIERWSLRLQPYDVTVVYRTGHDNPADYLSRHTPVVTEKSLREERVMEDYINYIATTSTPKSMTVAEIIASTKQDPTLQAAIEALQSGKWNGTTHKTDIDRNKLQKLCRIRHELSEAYFYAVPASSSLMDYKNVQSTWLTSVILASSKQKP